MSHDNAFHREQTPSEWAGKAAARPDVYEEQEDQWAVLRHEVEVEDMQRKNEPVRSDWDQRDTEDDTMSSSSPFMDLEEAPHHVDIVVAGVGGGGMEAVQRLVSTRGGGVRFHSMEADAHVVDLSAAQNRIRLGEHHTKGLGTSGNAAGGM